MKPAEAEQFAYLRWQEQTDASYYVNSTAISGDGSRVVAGTFYHVYTPLMDVVPQPPATPDDFATYCFDQNGKLLWSDPFQGFEGVYTVAVSADGSVAASGGWYSNDPYQGFVRAYDVQTGPPYLFHYPLAARVNSIAVSYDGSTIVAGADKAYLFQAENGKFPDTPGELTLLDPPAGSTVPNSVQAVAVTSDGLFVLIGDYYGNVYYVRNDNGSFEPPYVWNSTSMTRLHSVAMTSDGAWFAAAGSDSTVYVFSPESMTMGPPQAAGSYTLDTGGRVGWIAMSDDGSFITAIGNTGKTGAVIGISNESGTLAKVWETATAHNPNSTSMDAKGTYVTVADGYPDGQPGTFSLFDGSTGELLWSYPTTTMNWPMVISTDASGIAAGSDNGYVYYFTPTDTA
jgi:WD40 repeat protein